VIAIASSVCNVVAFRVSDVHIGCYDGEHLKLFDFLVHDKE
jgi:hypothetical protein